MWQRWQRWQQWPTQFELSCSSFAWHKHRVQSIHVDVILDSIRQDIIKGGGKFRALQFCSMGSKVIQYVMIYTLAYDVGAILPSHSLHMCVYNHMNTST